MPLAYIPVRPTAPVSSLVNDYVSCTVSLLWERLSRACNDCPNDPRVVRVGALSRALSWIRVESRLGELPGCFHQHFEGLRGAPVATLATLLFAPHTGCAFPSGTSIPLLPSPPRATRNLDVVY